MRNRKSQVNMAGTCIMLVLVMVFTAASLQAARQPESASGTPARADIVTIDTLRAYGGLERAPVMFQHSRHTEALEKQGKDCLACHVEEKDGLSLKFKRTGDAGRDAVMDVYHDGCISCHKETDGPTGPITCGGCHDESPELASSRQPAGMDKSLHYRHVKAMDNKCERCHHQYDAGAKKLIYVKGEEGTCRYCHKDVKQDNRISFRTAAHTGCVQCHRSTAQAKKETGPVTCLGCHDAQMQAQVKTIPDPPRMQRNQPDAVFVRTAEAAAPDGGKPGTPLVAFDHKAHEAYNDNCRVCHHAEMGACAACHTAGPGEKGGNVTLAQAMHQADAQQSCIGCHAASQIRPECAACHSEMPTPSLQGDAAACRTCHSTDAADVPEDLTSPQARAAAAGILAARTPVTGTYDAADIPETVKIKRLSDQYQPADLPHGKIVRTLMAGIGEDRLARYFHTEKGTLCQGCHHNAPASKKPPACATCHAGPFDADQPDRPGLMAAYHRQCMTCHAALGLEKPAATNCQACHLQKTDLTR